MFKFRSHRTHAKFVQTEKFGLNDLLIAVIMAAVTVFLTNRWEFPWVHPSVWEDTAVAAGVRPAYQIAPGYWTGLVSFLYRFVGVSSGAVVMRYISHLALGAIAIGIYAVLRETLAFIVRARPQYSVRRTAVMRFSAAVGTFVFVMSHPCWMAGQFFSESTILLALAVAALEYFLVFMRKGTLRYAYACMILLGFMTAETPFGIILLLILLSIYGFVAHFMPSMESPLFSPATMAVGKWHMTFLFLAALIAGVAFNCWSFIEHGGLAVLGETAGGLPLRYGLNYLHLLTGAADKLSWIVMVGCAVLPFVVTLILFPKAADEDSLLPYSTGIAYLFCGVICFSQFCGLPALWFWTYFPVKSEILLHFTMLMMTMTIATSVNILGVDVLCRNHGRLARNRFGLDAVNRLGGEGLSGLVLTRWIRRVACFLFPIAVVAAVLPGRRLSVVREMISFVQEFTLATLNEAGNVRYFLSDGNFDSILEFEAARRGLPLKCYALVGGGPLASQMRLRGFEPDTEDYFAFRFDTAMGLRAWIRDRPAMLKESAVQMAFDLWVRDGRPLPPMGGFLSRPAGFPSEKARSSGISEAHRLAARALQLHQRGGIESAPDPLVRRAYYNALWRLARMAHYRADRLDANGAVEAASQEIELAEQLQKINGTYQSLVQAMEKRNDQMLKRMTPREGLQLANTRADFMMGKVYAEVILRTEPDNPDACWAMAHFYLHEKQLTRSEDFFKRVLLRRPYEPAVYNNLAMLQCEMGKLEAAKLNVEKALKLVPNATAVLETKKRVDKAIEAAAKK